MHLRRRRPRTRASKPPRGVSGTPTGIERRSEPVIRAAADSVVREPGIDERLRLVDVAAVKEYRRLERLLDFIDARVLELVPLGHDKKRIGTVGRIEGVLRE